MREDQNYVCSHSIRKLKDLWLILLEYQVTIKYSEQITGFLWVFTVSHDWQNMSQNERNSNITLLEFPILYPKRRSVGAVGDYLDTFKIDLRLIGLITKSGNLQHSKPCLVKKSILEIQIFYKIIFFSNFQIIFF